MRFSEIGSIAYSVHNDLESIKGYVCSILGESKNPFLGNLQKFPLTDSLFGGVMSLDDFADFVYFEYFAGRFLLAETKEAITKHTKMLHEEYPKTPDHEKYAGWSEEEISSFFDSLLITDLPALNRRLYNIHEELVRRKLSGMGLKWVPINALKWRQENPDAAENASLEVGKGFYYQELTFSELRKHNKKVFEWMASARSRTIDYISFYNFYFGLINKILTAEYDKQALLIKPEAGNTAQGGKEKEDQLYNQTTYIAKAINLYKLEKTYKYSTMLKFARALSEKDPSYFSKKHVRSQRYFFADIPPHFFVQIPPAGTPIDCPDMNLSWLFTALSHNVNSLPQTAFQVPAFYFDRYTDFFLNADDQDKKVEEYRFCVIIYLAHIVIRQLWKKEVYTEYSHEKYIWFINNRHNMFALVKEYRDFNADVTIHSGVAKMLRNITDEMIGKTASKQS